MLETHDDELLRPEAKKLRFKKQQPIDPITSNKLKHECRILGPFPAGDVKNLTVQPKYKFKEVRLDEFVGRQLDMQKVFDSVQKERLTTVSGSPGIGKSALIKTMGAYLSERDVFSDGILFVSMTGMGELSKLIQQIYTQLLETEEHCLDQNSMRNYILEDLENRKCLLIIDNLELCINNSNRILSRFFKQLLEKA